MKSSTSIGVHSNELASCCAFVPEQGTIAKHKSRLRQAYPVLVEVDGELLQLQLLQLVKVA